MSPASGALAHPALLGAGGDLGREAARQAARDELAKAEYAADRPSLLVRAVSWVLEALARVLHAVPSPGGHPVLAALVLVSLLVLVTVVVLRRIGPLARDRRPAVLAGVASLPPADHRAAAEAAAAEGRWAEAVRERLRAVVRELELRGVLDLRPGRTAAEVASEAGVAVPALAPDLRRAATVFDEVWYGGRAATPASYAVLVQVDAAVAQARLVAA